MRSELWSPAPTGRGSIAIRSGIYYGRWRIGDRQLHRRLGPDRAPGAQDGLTGAMAAAKLRGLMHDFAIPPFAERVTGEDAGRRRLVHLTATGRKPSTLRSYANVLELRIKPSLGARVICNSRARRSRHLSPASLGTGSRRRPSTTPSG
jgi:hypothetical protein